MDETDNLKKYGNEFQYKCLSALVSDKLFLEQIFDILLPEYFESDANRWIIDKLREYYIQYKDAPTPMTFNIMKNEVENEVLKNSIKTQLIAIFSHINDTDMKFVKEQFLEFCRNQKLKSAIVSSIDYLKAGQYDNIKKVVDEALKAGSERNIGHEYFEDIETRMSQMARDSVRTNWAVIDQLTDGGLAKGELGFIVAPAGSGKSWLLARLGAEAMKQGKNVVHFTMELNENYVGLRYDSCFTGIDFQDIRNNVDVVRKKIEEIPGKLFIKYFPIKTIAPYHLKMHIERIQMLTGAPIHMIVVDYADLLRPAAADKNSNSYSESGTVYEELRGVAGELQIPVWSASQANRGAHEENVIQAHNVADSYRKIMTGDLILSLSRKKDDKLASTARVHVLKNRFGADGITFPTYFNSSNGDIRIYEENSPEGVELQQKMNDSEDSSKDAMREQWNALKKSKKFTDD
jgi:replicative DNA helicase